MIVLKFKIIDGNMKDRIREAAGELFSKNGVREVTIDDVCRHLGISKKTFYEHFSQKEDLVAEVIADRLNKKQEYFTSLLEDKNPVEVMKTIFVAVEKKQMFHTDKKIMRDVKKYYPQTLAKHVNKRHNVLKKKAKEYFSRGVEEGYFKKDIDMEAVIFLLSLMHKGMASYIDGETPVKDRNFSTKRMTSSFITIAQNAILSEKGWEEYKKPHSLENKNK